MEEYIRSKDEYGTPPPDYPAEVSSPAAEEITSPAPAFHVPSSDSRPLPPEIVEPGDYKWNKPGKKRKETAELMAWITAIVIILINMNVLTGSVAKSLADILNIDPSSISQNELVEIESSVPSDTTLAGSSETSMTSTTSSTSSGSSETSDPAAVTGASEVFETPDCEMLVFSFYSEVEGTLKFTGTASVDKITLEVWDVLTDTLEESRDITDDVLEDGVYSIPPFTTDEIYSHHQAEYDAILEFPMQVRFTVNIDYRTKDGTDRKSFSRITATDENMWFAKAIHEEDRFLFTEPIDVLFSTDSTNGQTQVLFDQPEKAGPNVISLSAQLDGKPFDISGSKLHTSSYDPGVEGSGMHYYSDLYILLPDGYAEGSGHTLRLSVSHYMAEYDTVCETIVDIVI